MNIVVEWINHHIEQTTPEQMAALAGRTFAASDRVPGAEGEAFDLNDWYAAAAAQQATPTHLIVRAADEFEAVIPWGQLGTALFQYRVEGLPLSKGKPIRLYVPDGSSACLNVKSIVSIRFVADESLSLEPSYGFRNEIDPSRLKQGLKSRG